RRGGPARGGVGRPAAPPHPGAGRRHPAAARRVVVAVAEPVLSPLVLTRRGRARAGWARIGHLERAGLAILACTTLVAIAAPLLAPHASTAPLRTGAFAAPGHGG